MNLSDRLSINPEEFSRTLKEIRQKRGFSQQDLAMEMTMKAREITHNPKYPTIAVEWVRRLEQGHAQSVSSERISLAAVALGVPVSDLLPGIELPPTSLTDVAVALRGYGVDDNTLRRILDEIAREKSEPRDP